MWLVRTFDRLFPAPKYLVRPTVGLDISDQSVKFIELDRRGRRLAVSRYGEKPIPVGTIESGLIKDQAALTKVLAALVAEQKFTQVVISLPEEEAYVVRLSLPIVNPAELRESLELQLEEHIPLPAAEIAFDFEILNQPSPPPRRPTSSDLSLSAFPKNTIVDYLTALAAAGLTPLAAEIEAQAIARAVGRAGDEQLALVVDFGKTRTSFFIVHGEVVLFTATANQIGGEDITKAVQKNLNLTYAAAEKLKIERGLLTIKNQRALFDSILPIVSVLRDEIVKHYFWWESRRSEQVRPDRSIERIIICGGQATLPGLIDYLNLNLDWPVELGNPWTNIFSFEDYIPELNLNQALRYTTALGLALRGLLPKL